MIRVEKNLAGRTYAFSAFWPFGRRRGINVFIENPPSRLAWADDFVMPMAAAGIFSLRRRHPSDYSRWTMHESTLHITGNLYIPMSEVSFTFTTSGGPGGQNVNRVQTRVTLWFDVAGSPSLSPAQKTKIQDRLSTRINKKGVLQVVAYKHRTQSANREEAVNRLAAILREALREVKPRKRTRVPRAAKERRLAAKKRHGFLKKQRTDMGGE